MLEDQVFKAFKAFKAFQRAGSRVNRGLQVFKG